LRRRAPPLLIWGTDVLPKQLVGTDNSPSLLEQVNSLPKMKDSDWQLVQNPATGYLELTVEGVHFVLIPVQVTQADTQQPADITIYADDSVTFVTGYGREIFAQPVMQDQKALLAALAKQSHDIIFQHDGTIKIKTEQGWQTYRVGLASEPATADQAVGLFDQADGAKRLVFTDNQGNKRQQLIYPVSTSESTTAGAEASEPMTSADMSSCGIDNGSQTTSPRIKSGKVAPGQAKKLAHDEAELAVNAEAVDTETTLCIESLYSLELPPLDPGMTNVTKGPRKGYRFFPRGMKFKNKVKVKIPYNKSLIPTGHSETDIKTYYFDKELGRWQELERAQVDSKGKQYHQLHRSFYRHDQLGSDRARIATIGVV
jgi:hypothetical protein